MSTGLGILDGGLRAAGLLAAAFVVGSALAQEAPRGQKPPEEPGFFESIGRWFERQYSNAGETFGDARKQVETFGTEAGMAAKATASGAKDAADVLGRIPNTRVIRGHEKCRIAANGAPDCVFAAETMCKARGFGSGKSLDMTTADECSPRVWASGRREAGDCKTITFVSRALCQ